MTHKLLIIKNTNKSPDFFKSQPKLVNKLLDKNCRPGVNISLSLVFPRGDQHCPDNGTDESVGSGNRLLNFSFLIHVRFR